MITTLTPNKPPIKLARAAKYELVLLGIAFLFGMAVNLIGLPDEITGTAKILTSVFLTLHAVVGLGLVVGAVIISRQARREKSPLIPLASIGGATIGIAFIAGIATVATDSGLLSFIMALGFIAAIFIYGNIMLLASKSIQS